MNKRMPDFFKNALNHGFIFGIIFIVLQLIFWMLNIIPVGFKNGMLMGLFNIILSIIILFLFTKQYRKSFMGDFISYGQALGYSLSVYMIATIILVLYTLIFTNFIDPEYTARVLQANSDWTEKFMRSKGVPDKDIAVALERMAKRANPSIAKTIIGSLVGGAVMGFISSLISSAFAKKLDNPLKD